MKTNYKAILAGIAVILAAACAKETLNTKIEVNEAVPSFRLSGIADDNFGTRQTLSGLTPHWTLTDTILLTYVQTDPSTGKDSEYWNYMSVKSVSPDGKTAEFSPVFPWSGGEDTLRLGSPKIGSKVCAHTPANASQAYTWPGNKFYPSMPKYDGTEALKDSSRRLYSPSIEKAVKNDLPRYVGNFQWDLDTLTQIKHPRDRNENRLQTAAISTACGIVGEDGSVSLKFKNLSPLLKIQLTGESSDISKLDSIVVRSLTKNMYISCDMYVGMADDGSCSMIGRRQTPSDSLDFLAPDGGFEAGTYYIAVAPTMGATKLELSFYGNGKKVVKTNDASNQIGVNTIYDLGAFDMKMLTEVKRTQKDVRCLVGLNAKGKDVDTADKYIFEYYNTGSVINKEPNNRYINLEYFELGGETKPSYRAPSGHKHLYCYDEGNKGMFWVKNWGFLNVLTDGLGVCNHLIDMPAGSTISFTTDKDLETELSYCAVQEKNKNATMKLSWTENSEPKSIDCNVRYEMNAGDKLYKDEPLHTAVTDNVGILNKNTTYTFTNTSSDMVIISLIEIDEFEVK